MSAPRCPQEVVDPLYTCSPPALRHVVKVSRQKARSLEGLTDCLDKVKEMVVVVVEGACMRVCGGEEFADELPHCI